MEHNYQPAAPPRPEIRESSMAREQENSGIRVDDSPVSREEFNALVEQVFRLNKTLEGIQQLFIKAGEYQGKPRGRLPR